MHLIILLPFFDLQRNEAVCKKMRNRRVGSRHLKPNENWILWFSALDVCVCACGVEGKWKIAFSHKTISIWYIGDTAAVEGGNLLFHSELFCDQYYSSVSLFVFIWVGGVH